MRKGGEVGVTVGQGGVGSMFVDRGTATKVFRHSNKTNLDTAIR